MKLLATKFDNQEIYFRFEKTPQGLRILNNVCTILFGEAEFYFDMLWQEGLSEEGYQSHKIKNIFLYATISPNFIHLLILGRLDKVKTQQVKKLLIPSPR